MHFTLCIQWTRECPQDVELYNEFQSGFRCGEQDCDDIALCREKRNQELGNCDQLEDVVLEKKCKPGVQSECVYQLVVKYFVACESTGDAICWGIREPEIEASQGSQRGKIQFVLFEYVERTELQAPLPCRAT